MYLVYEYKNKKGQKYYLHTKTVTLKSTKKKQQIFYFSKDPKGSIDLPSGYGIVENKKTGLPFLKKK